MTRDLFTSVVVFPYKVLARPLSVQWVREYATRWHTPTTKIPTSVDLPINADTKAVFDKAASLANVYRCDLVRTEHLLLALTTVPESHSAVALEEVGLSQDRLEAMLPGLPVAEQQAGNSLVMEDLLPEMF
jgi:ATP-dependent Clp protease ATP-binding subunit ClpA